MDIILYNMSVRNLLIITDADAIIALVNSSDANHQMARELSVKLASVQANVTIPITALTEAITTLQRKIDRPDLAQVIIAKVQQGDLQILNMGAEVIPIAAALYRPDGSKKNTFFDAMVAGVAQKHAADAIFSFDSWYKKQGFKMVHELF